jgi:hypothetical protein
VKLHRRNALLLPILLCLLASCSSQPASDADYHHAPLGWTMPIPRGWRVLPAEEVARIVEKGKDVMERSLGAPIEATQTELLYLKRGNLSVFTSDLQVHQPSDGVSYAQRQDEVIAAVLQAYRDADIPFRHERAKETVGGVEFSVLSVTLLARDGGRIIADQRMYDALIGEHEFNVSLTTQALADRDTLLSAWRASRFQPAAARQLEAAVKRSK